MPDPDPDQELVDSIVDRLYKKLKEPDEAPSVPGFSHMSNYDHTLHHEYVGEMIARRVARSKIYEKMRLSFLGAIAVAAAGSLITLGHWVSEIVAAALKR